MTCIFISHAHQDDKPAEAVVDLVRSAFNLPPDNVICTSLAGYKLRPGAEYNPLLKDAVARCQVMIALISERSRESINVNFELGARWANGKGLVPLLAPDANFEHVPEPLRDLTALSMRSEGDLQALIDELATKLQRTPNKPATYQAQIKRIQQLAPTARPTARPPDPSAVVASFFKGSQLGRRLAVSDDAKWAISKYCVHNGFWKSDDVVFIESGTLPVYMILDLCRGPEATRPRAIVTNNLACSVLAVASRPAAAPDRLWTATYPNEDSPANVFVMGGQVLDDYAGTIPAEWTRDAVDEESAGPVAVSDPVTPALVARGVNHVVMMVTKLLPDKGPCAASPGMRRYKKQLLRYVCQHSSARLSILGEAEKLIGRHGSAAEEVDGGRSRYWATLLEQRRVSLIFALSPALSPDDTGYIKFKMQSLRKAGATATLVDLEGNAIPLD